MKYFSKQFFTNSVLFKHFLVFFLKHAESNHRTIRNFVFSIVFGNIYEHFSSRFFEFRKKIYQILVYTIGRFEHEYFFLFPFKIKTSANFKFNKKIIGTN